MICIFNSEEVFEALKAHARTDKFAHNNLNALVFGSPIHAANQRKFLDTWFGKPGSADEIKDQTGP